MPVIEDTIIDVIDEGVLADTERLASEEARILLFLLTGRRSSEKISAKLSAEESNGEAFIRKFIVRNQQGQGRQPYYKALSARDLRSMEAVWIAPPVNPHSHVGWAAIKRNWEAYWPTFDQFSVSMRVTKVNLSGPVAWVHGIETSHRRKKTGEISSSRNYGTNIFVNRDGRWRMTFHESAMISKNSKG